MDKKEILQKAEKDIDLGTKPDLINLLAVGRLSQEKNFKHLIETCGWLRADGYNFHLNILGEGTERNNLEEQILSGSLDEFNVRMSDLRKELYGWIRYYTQLEDFITELEENRNKYFNSTVVSLFHLVANRVNRLKTEAQMLREYGLQVRELFQSEIDIRQNQVMKILAIVTTIFLPLTLVAGWYGMNFSGMPELGWKYGYAAVIVFSIVIVAACIVIMKKKKFW